MTDDISPTGIYKIDTTKSNLPGFITVRPKRMGKREIMDKIREHIDFYAKQRMARPTHIQTWLWLGREQSLHHLLKQIEKEMK